MAVAVRLLLKKGVKDANGEAVSAPEPMGRGMGCEDGGAGPMLLVSDGPERSAPCLLLPSGFRALRRS